MPKGYGKIVYERRIIYAHRAAWLLTYGAIPAGAFVLHRCDQPSCIRPEHLFVGTAADNSADMKRKGRAPTGAGTPYVLHPELTRGQRNPMAKLTPEIVLELRRVRAESGMTYTELGNLFGISRATAHLAVTGRTWGHLSPPGLMESTPH